MVGTDNTLKSLEPSFHQDLNGDGVVGVSAPTTVIESFGSTSLAQTGNNYFLYANGTSTGPQLKYGGAPIVTGQFSGWAMIGGEQTTSGYEVAWKNAATAQYTAWNVDNNGNYVANLTGAVVGTDNTLKSLEPSFHQDLNGDGVIGVPTSSVLLTSTSSLGTLVIAPTSGDVVLSGSAASDTFVFGPHFGNDKIANFQLGIDQIDIDHSLFATVSDLFSRTTDNANGSALITVAVDQSILVQDISKILLQQHSNDFHLI